MNEESESPEDDNEAGKPDSPENTGESQETEDKDNQDDEQNSETSDPDGETGETEPDGDLKESTVTDGESNDSDPETDDSGLTVYDFNHPQHRLGDPLPQFKHCGKKIARLVSDSIDTNLHVEATVELKSARYYKQNEFISALNQDDSVFRSEISPFSLDLNLVFPRELILSLVDLFFGGATQLAQGTGSRALSETEKRLAVRLRETIISAITNTCKDFFTITGNDDVFVSVDEWVTTSVEHTVLAVQEYTVACKDDEYNFSITFPWSAVESLVAFSSDDTPESVSQRNQWNDKMQEHLNACAVEMQGKLAETEVTVSQLLDMQKGDFIPLGEVGAATFMVDNTPIFDASIGASNGFVSASILQWSIDGDSRHE